MVNSCKLSLTYCKAENVTGRLFFNFQYQKRSLPWNARACMGVFLIWLDCNNYIVARVALTSAECETIFRAALQLFAIKLPLHLKTSSFQKSKFKFWPLNAIFKNSPSIRCPITSEIMQTTSVFLSSAKPVQALARRKSPLSTAILLPNSMSSW